MKVKSASKTASDAAMMVKEDDKDGAPKKKDRPILHEAPKPNIDQEEPIKPEDRKEEDAEKDEGNDDSLQLFGEEDEKKDDGHGDDDTMDRPDVSAKPHTAAMAAAAASRKAKCVETALTRAKRTVVRSARPWSSYARSLVRRFILRSERESASSSLTSV